MGIDTDYDCCEVFRESEMRHGEECDHFDGAPVHQWEVTTPEAVYSPKETD